MPAASSISLAAPLTLLRLRDDTFDPTNLGAYNLYLLLHPGRLLLAVLEVERQKFVVLEDYQLTAAGLPGLAAGHDFLAERGWHEVRLAVANRAFTLLPAPLFRPGDEAAALRLHHPLAPAETAHYRAHPGLELVNVFAADDTVTNWLTGLHGSAGLLLHHSSALLAGLVQLRGAGQPRRLYLSLGPQQLTLLVLGTQLEYCNVFPFSTPEDVVYYTILVMQELGLDPEQDELTVWGELAPDAPAFALLRTYVRHVRLGARPPTVQYSYRLGEVLEYRFFDLFSLHFV